MGNRIVISNKTFSSTADILDAIDEELAKKEGTYRVAPSIEELADRMTLLEECMDDALKARARENRSRKILFAQICVLMVLSIVCFAMTLLQQ